VESFCAMNQQTGGGRVTDKRYLPDDPLGVYPRRTTGLSEGVLRRSSWSCGGERGWANAPSAIREPLSYVRQLHVSWVTSDGPCSGRQEGLDHLTVLLGPRAFELVAPPSPSLLYRLHAPHTCVVPEGDLTGDGRPPRTLRPTRTGAAGCTNLYTAETSKRREAARWRR